MPCRAVLCHWLFPPIVLFCAVGVCSAHNNPWGLWTVGLFGLVGCVFHKPGAKPAQLRASPLPTPCQPLAGAD